MSFNDQINEAWAQLAQQKKLSERNVDQHNEQLSKMRAAVGQSMNVMHLQLKLSLEEVIRNRRAISMEDLFLPELHDAKGPILGGGNKAVNGVVQDDRGSFHDNASSVMAKRGSLLHAFQNWPEIKQILWEVTIWSHPEVASNNLLGNAFLDLFEQPWTIGASSTREFSWEEMEMIMLRFLQTLARKMEDLKK